MMENRHFSYQYTGDFSKLLGQLNRDHALASLKMEDPGLQKTIDIIQNLGDRIAVFFSRIQNLLQAPSKEKNIRFLADYFFKNFSKISENTKASRHIIAYCLKRPSWLKNHSDRIVESLKILYSDLLTLKIDCEQLYKSLFNSGLNYDFGLNFHNELASLDEIINHSTACRMLKLTPEATREEIKTAFRDLAKKLHPDLNPGASKTKFIRLEMAYKKMLEHLGQH